MSCGSLATRGCHPASPFPAHLQGLHFPIFRDPLPHANREVGGTSNCFCGWWSRSPSLPHGSQGFLSVFHACMVGVGHLALDLAFPSSNWIFFLICDPASRLRMLCIPTAIPPLRIKEGIIHFLVSTGFLLCETLDLSGPQALIIQVEPSDCSSQMDLVLKWIVKGSVGDGY